MPLTPGQKAGLAVLGIGGAIAVGYYVYKKVIAPPPPPPPGKGTLDVHAYYDTVVVAATVEIVELAKTYTAPFKVDLDPGVYTLKATWAGVSKTEVATVKETETTPVDFRFVGAVSFYVAITVDDDRGLRVKGAKVLLDGVSVGLTDADGFLTVWDVSPGTHKFRAEKAGYTPAEKTIDVQKNMDLRLTLTFIVITYTVTVTVKDAKTGDPIPYATVGLNGYGGYTDARGICVIRDVPEGTYHVSAGTTGYYAAGKDISVTADTPVTLSLTPIPVETAHVRIGVMDIKTYLAVSGAKVVMNGYEAVTGPSGYVDFYNVPYDSYVATASKTGYQTRSVVVVVASSYVSPGIWLYPASQTVTVLAT